MSVHNMKPQFRTQAEYQQWRKEWRGLYAHVSRTIRRMKDEIKSDQRGGYMDDAAKLQKELKYEQAVARKLMTVHNEAKIRWQNIKDAKRALDEQYASFPLTIENARNIEFHFNKKSLELPFIPMWTLKAKGQSYYLNHIECTAPWTTRENPDHPSTKGSLGIKRGTISIDADGSATIS